MRQKIFPIAWILYFSLAACAPNSVTEPAKTPMPMANDFSFVFQDIACGEIPLNVLYTNSGVLVHTPIGEYNSITIPFHLSDSELRTIYEKMTAIDFFDIPSDFAIPTEYFAVTEVPVSSYLISATNKDKSHILYWVGGTTHTDYPKAIQLMELITLIQNIIQSHPEYQQLPAPSAGCA